MKLSVYKKTILSSSLQDWNVIFQNPGYGATEKHTHTATNKTDTNISLSWGIFLASNFTESWANSFTNRSAHFKSVDFYYNAQQLHRENYVEVDGGRCNLPLFKIAYDDNIESPKLIELRTTKEQIIFFDLLNQLASQSLASHYIEQLRKNGFPLEITNNSEWISDKD